MAELFGTLRTPRLDPRGEVEIAGASYKLVGLDWSRSDREVGGCPSLPGALLRRVDSFLYAVSRRYQDHITYHACQAAAGWSHDSGGLEYWLREEGRKPAISSIRAMCFLLADCVVVPIPDRVSDFSVNTQSGVQEPSDTSRWGFLKGADKRLIPFYLLLRFWGGQVHPSKVLDYAGIHELEIQVLSGAVGNGSAEPARSFLKKLKEHCMGWVDYTDNPSQLCLHTVSI